MYLHVGNQKNIRKRDIIGIFDADRTTASGVTRRYLAKAEERGQVDSAREEIPKAFVVYVEEDFTGQRGKSKIQKKKNTVRTQKICFSQLAVSTLVKRIED